MKPDYQFDDPDKTLPVWKVSYEHIANRSMRMPFFKRTVYARAANRQDAINKIISIFGDSYDRFRASKVKTIVE